MLAARYLGPHHLEPVEIAVPEIGKEEALIKVEACGFCGSDLGILAGIHPRARAPLTLGHEVCGTIEQINSSDSRLKPGDRVSVNPLISCGKCYVCRHGDAHVCRSLRLYGIDADGGMAQYVRLPVSALYSLPAGMSAIEGALVEPLAVAVHGVAQTHVPPAARAIVVMGAGPIGILTALVARAMGADRMFISDVLPFRIALATKLGLQAVHAGEELRQLVADETSGDGADLVFECVGVPETLREMTTLVRSRGTIVNLGVSKKPAEVDMQAVNFKEITILGSRVYRPLDFQRAIELAGLLPVAGIATHTFPLAEVGEAFERFRQGTDVCKTLILPNGKPG